MSLLRWLVRLLQPKEVPSARAYPPSEPSWKKYAGGAPSSDYLGRVTSARQSLVAEDYRHALTHLGLSEGSDADIAFLRGALSGVEWPKGITIRKHGTPLTKDELKSLGYRSNLILSRECLAVLSEQGRRDPVESTQFIVSAVESRVAFLRQMANTLSAVGSDTMIQVYANTMAAGPCAACTAIAAKPVPLTMAPSGPLPECPHPDQCQLFWRTHLTFD